MTWPPSDVEEDSRGPSLGSLLDPQLMIRSGLEARSRTVASGIEALPRQCGLERRSPVRLDHNPLPEELLHLPEIEELVEPAHEKGIEIRLVQAHVTPDGFPDGSRIVQEIGQGAGAAG